MTHIVRISANWKKDHYNVDLLCPDGKYYMAVTQMFQVRIRKARAEAKRIAELYHATIEDCTRT